MSSERDLARLVDSDWRRRAADGIAQAIGAWAVADESLRDGLRQ
jgi:N-acetylmuramoyl-L-alanine amidase